MSRYSTKFKGSFYCSYFSATMIYYKIEQQFPTFCIARLKSKISLLDYIGRPQIKINKVSTDSTFRISFSVMKDWS